MQHHHSAGFVHATVPVDGEDLHVVTLGSGEPVLLLHGWPTTWYEWHAVMPGLAAAGYRAIAVDTPGLGLSAPSADGYAKRVLASRIRGLVDALDLGRIHLVGHDLGGQIAYAYGQDHPVTLKSLALLEIVMAGLDGWDQIHLWHWGLHQVPGLIETLAEGRERAYFDYFFKTHVGTPGAVTDEEIAEHVRAYQRPGVFHRGIEYYRSFDRDADDNRAVLGAGARLAMPVLWMTGGASMGPLMQRQLAPVADRLSGEIVPGMGHWLPQECPGRIVASLVGFWKANAG